MTAKFESEIFFFKRGTKKLDLLNKIYMYIKKLKKTLNSYFIDLKIFLLIEYSVFFKT